VRLFLGLTVLVLITLTGSRFLQARFPLPVWLQRFFDSGLIFLVLGVALGPAGLQWINQTTLIQTNPLVLFFLGWIGFLFGAHLEWRRLRRVSGRLWAAMLGESLPPLLLVGAAAWWFFDRYLPDAGTSHQRLAALITLSACASGTAPASVFWLGGRPLFTGATANQMRLLATLDDLPGLLVFGLMFVLLPPPALPDSDLWAVLLWLPGSVLIGVIMGYLLRALATTANDEQVTFLIVLGIIGFTAGFSAYVHLSPIFTGAVAGYTFVNTSRQKEKFFAVLAGSEHPIYVLFLILVGCHWTLSSESLYGMVLLYLGVRLSGKVGGGALAFALLRAPQRRHHWAGLGLLGQGGMAVALAINYQLTYASPFSATVVTVLILGVFINELLHSLLAGVPFGRPAPPGRNTP